MFPSADQIAFAIVTACSLAGTNPVLTALGRTSQQESRGRHVAFAGLIEAFPAARRCGLERCVGYRPNGSATANLKVFRTKSWWREEWVDEVVGVLVADQYGEQAA